MIDWLKIKNEYISTRINTRALAEKHGISVSTLLKRSAAEGRGAEKKKQGSKIEAKVKQKAASQIASREADRLTHLLSIGDTLASKLEQAVSELDQTLGSLTGVLTGSCLPNTIKQPTTEHKS